MKKSFLLLIPICLWMCFLGNTELRSESSTENKSPPCVLTTFQHEDPGSWRSMSTKEPIKIFKCRFKITDNWLTSLDLARIYLFSEKKELIHTLDNLSGQNIKNIPNLVSSLEDLKPNKVYCMLFPYTASQVKWKYAIAVIGMKDRVVADILPASSRIEDFEFKEKGCLVK